MMLNIHQSPDNGQTELKANQNTIESSVQSSVKAHFHLLSCPLKSTENFCSPFNSRKKNKNIPQFLLATMATETRQKRKKKKDSLKDKI